MAQAFIISWIDGYPIAEIETDLRGGSRVYYAYGVVKDEIRADREFNLVNMFPGRISRAKKVAREYTKNPEPRIAKEVNAREYLIR